MAGPREEAIEGTPEDKLAPEQARRFRDENRQVIETAAPLVVQEEVDAPDGRHLSLYTVRFPVRDASGRVGAVGGISFDISERKRAEASLVESTNRYDAAVEATGQILYDWDTASDMVTFGGNCEAILGYSPEGLSGGLDRWVELIHPEDRGDFAAEIELRPNHQAGIPDGLSSPAPGRPLPHGPGRGPLLPQPRRDAGSDGRLRRGHHRAEAHGEGAAGGPGDPAATFYDSAPLAMGVVESPATISASSPPTRPRPICSACPWSL